MDAELKEHPMVTKIGRHSFPHPDISLLQRLILSLMIDSKQKRITLTSNPINLHTSSLNKGNHWQILSEVQDHTPSPPPLTTRNPLIQLSMNINKTAQDPITNTNKYGRVPSNHGHWGITHWKPIITNIENLRAKIQNWIHSIHFCSKPLLPASKSKKS